MNDQSKSVDLLGIKPVSESINKLTSAGVDGASAFLSRICLPAAEEFGLLLQDKVKEWRSTNLSEIVMRAEEKLLNSSTSECVHANPRIVSEILDEGSWIEDSVVQDLWAGLLSSACTESGDDDSNLLFVNLLSQLTKMQVKILNHTCCSAKKHISANNLIYSDSILLSVEELILISDESDLQRLDREMDHLREIGLVDGGFTIHKNEKIRLMPTPLALHMYVRCQGSRLSAIDFFELNKSG